MDRPTAVGEGQPAGRTGGASMGAAGRGAGSADAGVSESQRAGSSQAAAGARHPRAILPRVPASVPGAAARTRMQRAVHQAPPESAKSTGRGSAQV